MNTTFFIDLLSSLAKQGAVNIFFKLFSLIFSVMYATYAFIIFRQTKLMIQTIQVKETNIFEGKIDTIILFISQLQLYVSICIVLFAILIVTG